MVYLLFIIVIKSFVVLIASYVEVLKVNNSVVPDAVDLIIYLDHRCFRYYNFLWGKKRIVFIVFVVINLEKLCVFLGYILKMLFRCK